MTIESRYVHEGEPYLSLAAYVFDKETGVVNVTICGDTTTGGFRMNADTAERFARSLLELVEISKKQEA